MAWEVKSGEAQKATPSAVIPKGMPHVCICVPHWGSVSLEWVETTYGPLRFLAHPQFAKSNKISRGILNLDTERELLVDMVLEDKTVTHILWLDTDCVMENPPDSNEAVVRLLMCNVPIVSGLYRAKKSKGDYPYAMWFKNPNGIGYLGISEWTGNFIKVDAIGLGFCLIKREVYENVPKPWFRWDRQYPSEDFDFCEKAIKHDYEVKVYTDVKLSHVGTLKVRIDGKIHSLDV